MFNPEDLQEPFGHGKLEINGVEYDVPYLAVKGEIDGVLKTLNLSWGSTTVRCFYFQEELNHIEYRENGHLMGIRLPEEIIEEMLRLNYPAQFDPWVDSNTLDWFASMEVRSLDDELDEL